MKKSWSDNFFPMRGTKFKIKHGDDYATGNITHPFFEKTKRKNALTIEGFYGIFYTIMMLLRTHHNWDSSEQKKLRHYIIEYENNHGYFKSIPIKELFDLDKMLEVSEEFEDLIEIKNFYNAMFRRKYQKYSYLMIDYNSENKERHFKELGVKTKDIGYQQNHSSRRGFADGYMSFYVMENEEDCNLVMLTLCPNAKIVDLVKARAAFDPCIKPKARQ